MANSITITGVPNLTLAGRNVKRLPVWPTNPAFIVPIVGGIDLMAVFGTGFKAPTGYSLSTMPTLTTGDLPLSNGALGGSAGVVFGIDGFTVTGTTAVTIYDLSGNVAGFGNTTAGSYQFLKGYTPFSGDASPLLGTFSQWAEIDYLLSSGLGLSNAQQVQLGAIGTPMHVSPSFSTSSYAGKIGASGRMVRFVGDSTHVGLGSSSTGGIMQQLTIMGMTGDFFRFASASVSQSAANAGATVDLSASWDLSPYCLPGIGSTPLSSGPSVSPLSGCHVRIEALTWDNNRYLMYDSSAEFDPVPPLSSPIYSYLQPQKFDPYFGKPPLSDTSFVLLISLTLPSGAVLQNYNENTRWTHIIPGTLGTVPYWVINNLIGGQDNQGTSPGPYPLIPDGDPSNLSSGGSPIGIYAQVDIVSTLIAPGAEYVPIGSGIGPPNTTGSHWSPLNQGGPVITVFRYSGDGPGASHHQVDALKRPTFAGQKDSSLSGTGSGVTLYKTRDAAKTFQGFDVPTGGVGRDPTLLIDPRTDDHRIIYSDGTSLLRAETVADGEISGSWTNDTIQGGAYPASAVRETTGWADVYLAYLDENTLKLIASSDGGRNFVDLGEIPDYLDFRDTGRAALALLGTRLILAYVGPHPEDPDGQVLVARTSTDGGQTFSDPVTVLEGRIHGVTMAAFGGQIFLASIEKDTSKRNNILLSTSADLGETWSPMPDIPRAALLDNVSSALGFVPRTATLLYGPGYRSNNLGTTWQKASS